MARQRNILVISASIFIAMTTSLSGALASPDVDFPVSGQSYGGKVRSGPGTNYRQVGSTHEGDRITIIRPTGNFDQGFDWFEIRYSNGRRGYQSGGLMCADEITPGTLQTCSDPNGPMGASAPRHKPQNQMSGGNHQQHGQNRRGSDHAFAGGGIVRSGPGMNYRKVTSLQPGTDLWITEDTGVWMDQYPWYKVRWSGQGTGYVWGGIICRAPQTARHYVVVDGCQ